MSNFNLIKKNEKGYVLILLIFILSIVIATSISIGTVSIFGKQSAPSKEKETLKRMEVIKKAISMYYKGHNKDTGLPDPDSFLQIGGSNVGVPVTALNLESKYRTDGFGRPLYYYKLGNPADIVGIKVDSRDMAGVLISPGTNQQFDSINTSASPSTQYPASGYAWGDDMYFPINLSSEAQEIVQNDVKYLADKIKAYSAACNNLDNSSLNDLKNSFYGSYGINTDLLDPWHKTYKWGCLNCTADTDPDPDNPNQFTIGCGHNLFHKIFSYGPNKVTQALNADSDDYAISFTDNSCCPVAYWQFDLPDRLKDMATNGDNSLKFNVGTGPIYEKIGEFVVNDYIKFDGNDNVDVMSINPISNKVFSACNGAISMWFKPVSLSNGALLLDSSDGLLGFQIYLNNTSGNYVITARVGPGTHNKTDTGTPYITVRDQFYHLVVTWSANNKIDIYLDGAKVATYSDSSIAPADLQGKTIVFGAAHASTTGSIVNPFIGYMDEIAYFNKYANQSDVTKWYNNGMAHNAVCQ